MGKIVTISSRKGGVGKTTTLLNIAGCLSTLEKKVLILDLDLYCSSIAVSLNLKSENIAVVGDQIFTDVIGGNRCNMFTILVDPVDKKDYWYTAWKRPIENKFKKRLVKGELNVF